MREAFDRVKVPLFGILGIVAITMIAFAVVKPEVYAPKRGPFSITGNAVADDALFDGKVTPTGECASIEEPVCGTDGRTYRNLCEARTAHVDMRYPGPCDKGSGR